MSNKTLTDCNDVSVDLAKNCINEILKSLTAIHNQSFNTGVFPDRMKIAKVIPIFKSGNKNSFDNYRPISLLPSFHRILENIFYKGFEKFT